MIEKISIENFQSHKSTELILSKGVNIILGQSDSGKTAIIRAIRWALQNKPNGDGMRSNWGGDTQVAIQFNDGTVIRRRTNSRNEYCLKQEENALEFTAFKQEVPNEIKAMVNMSEENLQQQLDSPFLLQDTPGQVATHFNKVANLSAIDTSLAYINSGVAKSRREEENCIALIDKKQKQLDEFIDLKKMESEISAVEKRHLRFDKFKRESATIAFLVEEIEELTELIGQEIFINKCEKEVDFVLTLYSTKEQYQQEKRELRKLATSIFYLGQEIQEGELLLKTEEPIRYILQLYTKQEELEKEIKSLTNQYDQAIKQKKKIEELENKVVEMEYELKEAIGDVCPLCDTQL